MKPLDCSYFDAGHQLIIGVDEVGRGCLAGVVTAAAVLIDASFQDPGIADSKKLSARKRQQFDTYIRAHARDFEIIHINVETIDRINIRNASLLAMKQAINALCLRHPRTSIALVDGNTKTQAAIAQDAIIKGDDKSTIIGAAAIIAKVSRDTLMLELDQQFPNYGFRKHKGYGTQVHRQAIHDHGPTPLHRKTFKGVREYL